MYKIFIFSALLFLGCITALPVPDPKIHAIPGQSKTQIFNKVQQWIVSNFRNGGNVIQFKDLAEGKIIAQGKTMISMPIGGFYYNFTWTIDIKDGKVKIGYTGDDCGGASTCTRAFQKMDSMAQSMVQFISGKSTGSENNW